MPWQARKLRSLAPMPCRLVQYSIAMAFEQALRDGDLDHARAILDELAELPDTGYRRTVAARVLWGSRPVIRSPRAPRRRDRRPGARDRARRGWPARSSLRHRRIPSPRRARRT